jgi:uncharacterized protein
MMSVIESPSAGTVTKIDVGIIDCDVHPLPKDSKSLNPYLARRWQEHSEQFGTHLRQPFINTTQYPRTAPLICRRDAWPPAGGPPGSDLAFMQQQHLDPFHILKAILIPLFGNVASERNQDFARALATAHNDWQVAEWLDRDARLRASLVVTQDDPVAAAKEIERVARDGRFVQIMLAPRSSEPLGRQRYWPIYEAAQAHDLPLGIHSYGIGGHASTGGGWPSFYMEEHYATTMGGPAVMSSMVMEGVFEKFPALKVVLVEIGFAWVPSFAWRLDRLWERLGNEVPHLTRPPSDYIRKNFWYTTQPMEEPAKPEALRHCFDWLGWDRLLFSTDYPHWDQDDPSYAFKVKLSPAERKQLCRGNAENLYRF